MRGIASELRERGENKVVDRCNLGGQGMLRMMTVLMVFASACATTEGSTARTSEAYCGIATPRWSSASRDFDRRATLECLDTIAEAAKTDRDRLHAGAKNDVGEQLDRDFLEEPPSGFVGSGAASLAVRLRQLDCGVRSGRIQFSAADALYDQILAEIRAERATLDPAVNTSRVEPR